MDYLSQIIPNLCELNFQFTKNMSQVHSRSFQFTKNMSQIHELNWTERKWTPFTFIISYLWHFSIPWHWQSQFYFKFSLLLEVESCEMFHLSTRIIYVVILTFDFWWEWNRCFEFENRIWYVYKHSNVVTRIVYINCISI